MKGSKKMKEIYNYWKKAFHMKIREQKWIERTFTLMKKRDARIVKIRGKITIYERLNYDGVQEYSYLFHVFFFIQQKDNFYIEERIMPYKMISRKDKIYHVKQQKPFGDFQVEKLFFHKQDAKRRTEHLYNRQEAVRYAERWWNDYNPLYRNFQNNCANFVSQCLQAGGGKMWGSPNRSTGWWYEKDQWSYSWSVAHSLRWFLSGSTLGLKGTEQSSARDLIPGDVICYDFEGDGRWDHIAIVVSKDANDEPLVNAHTRASRKRYWAYEDSLAWTENIQYKFFRISI